MSVDDAGTRSAAVGAGELERGRMLADLGRFPEAVQVLAGVAAREQTGDAWCELGRARLGAGDPTAALDAALRAGALEPGQEWPHRLASAALAALGRDDEAVAAAQAAVRAAPLEWQTHAALAQVAAGRAQLRLLAGQAAAEAARLAPDEAGAHHAERLVAMAYGWHDRAEAACRRILTLDPDDDAARNDLALIEGRRGGIKAATTGFLASAAADPAEPVYRGNVEVALWTWMRMLAAGVFAAGTLVNVWIPGSPGAPLDEVPLWLRGVALLAVALVGVWAAFLARQLPRDAWPYVRHVLLPRPLVRAGLGLLGVAVLLLAAAAVAPAPVLGDLVTASRIAAVVPVVGCWVAAKRVHRWRRSRDSA